MRENVFTAFAKRINMFCEHKINKWELFESFVDCIELCDEGEREERKRFLKEKYEFNKSSLSGAKGEYPRSNYDDAIRDLDK